MKVLIAEDDEDQLAVREMLLKQAGFEALTASGTAAALEVATVERPACALVDLRLPDEKSGLRLIRELKKKHPSMRIIVLTGGNLERVNRLPERALMEEVIAKGSSAAMLIRRIRGDEPAN